ncbi:hypothetical protein K2Y11_12955 [bacterium]|nr:hypothetical protein [bacterium]
MIRVSLDRDLFKSYDETVAILPEEHLFHLSAACLRILLFHHPQSSNSGDANRTYTADDLHVLVGETSAACIQMAGYFEAMELGNPLPEEFLESSGQFIVYTDDAKGFHIEPIAPWDETPARLQSGSPSGG